MVQNCPCKSFEFQGKPDQLAKLANIKTRSFIKVTEPVGHRGDNHGWVDVTTTSMRTME